MVINRAGQAEDLTRSGYALLLAAAPARGALVDVDGVLPRLAAVPPDVLAGAQVGSVVQLAHPSNPHAVLAALRTAAAHPGPLLLVVVGQLLLDKGLTPHVALARSTARSVRYDGVPWAWVVAELRSRPAESTAVLADLVADAAVWERRGSLALADGGLRVFGTLAPPPPRRRTARPRYAHALAEVLRSVASRPPLAELHQAVLEQAEVSRTSRLVLGAQAVPDPHGSVRAAARAGRYAEAAALAAAHEQAALRAGGPRSREAVHWLEVQADIAWLAGQPQRAAAGWIRVAVSRLAAGEAAESAEVVLAVDQAHHCWLRVVEPVAARLLGEELEPLRRAVPGRRPGALEAFRQRLAGLSVGQPGHASD
ncbi:hypothetical protein [Streptomyces johnsoniae]|uniref:Uncharacterized protein n=1 Tax=Streptomyces johnsoniae TaxID=3075532 RepID=A0ABU2SBJ2_9ACTN|nr:hypothetical protein [Streptomyces sp. DSM 41886]MDT0446348.1 hypothetical protein [Streptomyces sp. DSM 41886]